MQAAIGSLALDTARATGAGPEEIRLGEQVSGRGGVGEVGWGVGEGLGEGREGGWGRGRAGSGADHRVGQGGDDASGEVGRGHRRAGRGGCEGGRRPRWVRGRGGT